LEGIWGDVRDILQGFLKEKWTDMAQYRVQWWTFFNMVTKVEFCVLSVVKRRNVIFWNIKGDIW
jgi:hypothetical protein